jgi:hypothetical protein
MHEDTDKAADLQYGPWPWIVGLVLAVIAMGLMFVLATGSR